MSIPENKRKDINDPLYWYHVYHKIWNEEMEKDLLLCPDCHVVPVFEFIPYVPGFGSIPPIPAYWIMKCPKCKLMVSSYKDSVEAAQRWNEMVSPQSAQQGGLLDGCLPPRAAGANQCQQSHESRQKERKHIREQAYRLLEAAKYLDECGASIGISTTAAKEFATSVIQFLEQNPNG